MKRVSKRKKALGLFLIGNLLPIGYVLWMCFGPPRDITISKETTFITTPLSEDGRYVDYEAYLKEEIGDHDPEDDLWLQLTIPPKSGSPGNKPLLLPHPSQVNTPSYDPERKDIRERLPFTEKEDPEYAEFVRGNELWYETVMATDPGPVAVSSEDSKKYGIGLPITDLHFQLTDLFLLRGSLVFGEADFNKATESVEFILRIAERERSVPLLTNQWHAFIIASRGLSSVATGLLWSEEIPEQILRRWDEVRFPVSWSRWLRAIEFFRLELLANIQSTHASRASDGWFNDYADAFGKPAGNWFTHRVDFGAAMNAANRSYDEVARLFALKDFQESIAAMQRLDKRVVKQWPSARVNRTKPTLTELLTENHTAWVAQDCSRVSFLGHHRSRIAYFENVARRVRICVRLHVYRKRHGHWPDSLEELLDLEGWTASVDDLLTDSYSNSSIKYARDGEGFVMYSVGRNGVDDTNGRFPDRSDSKAWQQSPADDLLWPWPPILPERRKEKRE